VRFWVSAQFQINLREDRKMANSRMLIRNGIVLTLTEPGNTLGKAGSPTYSLRMEGFAR